MTSGADLKNARESVDVDHYVFAKAIGVHVSCIYRWEEAARDIGAAPLHRDIVDRFVKWAKKTPARDRNIFSGHLRRCVADDPLGALHLLLGTILEVE